MMRDIGPFTFYRVRTTDILDVSLKAFPNAPFGWEYGWDEILTKPWINIRIGKLRVLYYEPFKKGFHVAVLGFWWVR